MTLALLETMAHEGFEELLLLHDRHSGATAYLCIHDSSRGPAFGGIRRWSYREEADAALDCLRLARAMSLKCAVHDLPAGGGKIVLLDRPDLDSPRAYRFLGEAVERLAGRFYTGPDMGTGPTELAAAAQGTRYVTAPGPDGPGELPESTAEGVFAGILAALEHVHGRASLSSRRVVVQGLGEVGARLARRLVESGAQVFGAELDPLRAAEVAADVDLELVDPARELDVPCDVLVPCAMGGLLHDLSIERLRCRIVAGAANNVLARPEHADRLAERGILYVPDFVLNSGALIRGSLFHLEGRREPVPAIGKRVGQAVERILERARSDRLPPARVAVAEAEERIDRARREETAK
jgi:leucine dehydrogenase